MEHGSDGILAVDRDAHPDGDLDVGVGVSRDDGDGPISLIAGKRAGVCAQEPTYLRCCCGENVPRRGTSRDEGRYPTQRRLLVGEPFLRRS